jgi:glutamine kinase
MLFGTKAENLIKLKLKSANIPRSIFFNVKQIKLNFDKCYKLIEANFRKKIIIRSSSLNEDSFKQSKAGTYKTFANIKIDKEIIKRCINEIIESYGDNNDKNQILIQEYLSEAKISGVVTTCNLDNYGPYYNINYSKGKNTSQVTSGKDNTFNNIIFRKPKYSKLKKLDVKIIRLCQELEKIFNYKYLDIEFLYQNNYLYLLQVRPIVIKKKSFPNKFLENTILIGLKKLEKKIIKMQKKHYGLYGNTTFFGVMPDWNPAEIIGIKPKELSSSLYRELITNKVWAENRDDYGYRNVRSNHLMTNFLGTPYIDVRVDFNSWIPKSVNENLAKKLIKYYLNKFRYNTHLHDKIEFEILFTCFTASTKKKIGKLKNIFSIKETSSILSSLKNVNLIAIKNLDKEISKIDILKKKQIELKNKKIYPIEKIYWLIEDCKNYGTSCFAGMARCGFIAIELLNSFVDENIINEGDKKKFLNSLDSITSEMIRDMNKDKSEFIKKYGHLRPNTYDICSKNYRDGYKDYFSNYSKKEINYSKKTFSFNKNSQKKISVFCKSFSKNKISKDDLINFIKKSIYFREYSKFVFSKSIDLIFENLKLLSQRSRIGIEDIQHLDIQIVKDLYYSINTEDIYKIFKKNIDKNFLNYQIDRFIKLPEVITNTNDIYSFVESPSKINFIGDKRISSKVKIINNSNKCKNLVNKIVCIENADPGYDYLFNHKITGLITKYGGANSHMAIRCAELNIVAAIGVGNHQFSKIEENKKLLLDPINKKITFF